MTKELLSTTEAAKILGISRVAVFKKIKSGDIPARKVGRSFVIEKKNLPNVLGAVLYENERREIEKSVRRTVKEYGQTLKLLGKE